MGELLEAGVVLIVLLASTVLGLLVQSCLTERYRSQETTDLVRLVIAMLVTFTALVLGLLITSVKSSFDKTDNQLKLFAAQLIQLDQSLRQYGADTDKQRQELQTYTAAAIVSTWVDEPRPSGNSNPEPPLPSSQAGLESAAFGEMLARVERMVRQLEPPDAMHRRLAADCVRQFERLSQLRWHFVENAGSGIPLRFTIVLVFWLAIVFASFGLHSPRNILAYATIVLAAVSIASAIYLILDLDSPYGGAIATSSHPMRDALTHLSH
jgi:hypothetical protein